MKKLIAALLLCLSGSACLAQSVQQSGTITPNHLAIWATNGVIKDGGSPTSSANLIINQTQITSGTNKGLLFDNNGVVGNLGTLANGLLVTDASGNPSISATLPAGINLNVTIGTTSISSGTNKGLLFDNNGLFGNLATSNSGVLVTDGSGNPSISTTLPASLTIPSPNITGILTLNGIIINPAAASLDQAINSTQSGPTSGTPAGPIMMNVMNGTFSSGSTGSGKTFNLDNGSAIGFRNEWAVGGSNYNLTGEFYGGLFQTNVLTTGGSTVENIALGAQAYANVTSSAFLWGFTSASIVDSGGTVSNIGGAAVEAGIWGTGSVTGNRYGLSIYNTGSVQAAGTVDTAINVATIGPNSSSGGAFKKLINISGSGGAQALSSSGDLFFADTAFTIANVFNLPNATVSGDILNFPNLVITGDGHGVIGSGTAPTATDLWNITCASCGAVQNFASVNGTFGFDGLLIQTSSGSNELSLGTYEASNTLTRFGQTAGNFAIVGTLGGSNLGLLFGTETAEPLIIGTNNTAVLTIAASGSTTIAGASFGLTGNISAAAWTTSGVRYKNASGTLTDTTSSGTVAAAYTSVWGGNTIAASNAVTFTDYFGGYFQLPTNGTNVTFTRSWALGADNAQFGTSNAFKVNAAGHVTIEGVTSTGATGTGNLVFATSPSFTLSNVATTSAVCYNQGTGVITFDGAIGTCNTSDERLKIFDRHPRDSLVALVALSHDAHFGYFHASARGYDQFGTGEHLGIGAQTAERFFPELTATGSDGLMSLAYDKLTVPIIEALSELKADNDNLRAEITRLKREIAR